MVNHILKSWKHHLSLQIATVVVLVASFTVVLGVLTVSQNLFHILTLWGESMQMSVYVQDSATDQSIRELQEFLTQNKNIDQPKFISKENALSQFREQLASYAPDIINDKDLVRFIPSSFQFGLSKNVPATEQLTVMTEISNALKSLSAVEDVSFGQDWVKSYSSFAKTLSFGGILFVCIVIASAIFVMSNSIHTSISQRRNEIEVLELIGATQSYIRKPFIFEGALLGGIASVISILISYIVYIGITDYLHSQLAFLQIANHIQFIRPEFSFLIVFVGVVLGAMSSWFCVRKINDGWAATQVMRA